MVLNAGDSAVEVRRMSESIQWLGYAESLLRTPSNKIILIDP